VADYDVQYDKDSGDWSAKRAGAGKAAGRYDTQAEAHAAARGFAERSGGGEVRDHRKDNNQIRNTDTVGKRIPTHRRAEFSQDECGWWFHGARRSITIACEHAHPPQPVRTPIPHQPPGDSQIHSQRLHCGNTDSEIRDQTTPESAVKIMLRYGLTADHCGFSAGR
jgi:hypothetical protein